MCQKEKTFFRQGTIKRTQRRPDNWNILYSEHKGTTHPNVVKPHVHKY